MSLGIGEKDCSEKPEDIWCEHCGSLDMEEDFEGGEVVCNDCGLVESGKLLDPSGHSRYGEDAHNTNPQSWVPTSERAGVLDQ